MELTIPKCLPTFIVIYDRDMEKECKGGKILKLCSDIWFIATKVR